MRLGAAVFYLRKMEFKSQQTLADELGLNKNTVRNIEEGRGCNAETFARLMAWLVLSEPHDAILRNPPTLKDR